MTMLLLASTADKIRLTTSAAGDIEVHSSWVDNAAGVITPGRTNVNPTTATTTDLVASPAASTIRNVKTLNIRNVHANNANTLTVIHTDGTLAMEIFKCSLLAQETLTYVEGIGWDIYAADGNHKAQSARTLFKALAADDTGGQNVNTAQPWFPTAGALSVEAATAYIFEGQLYTTRAAGAVSHTTGLLFGGTATLTSIDWWGEAKTGDTNALAATNGFWSTTAASLVVKAASVATTENAMFALRGIVRINAAGTFIPQFIYSAAPGGAPTVKRGSMFRMYPGGDNNVVSQGTWS
jgi:hypothetical protein